MSRYALLGGSRGGISGGPDPDPDPDPDPEVPQTTYPTTADAIILAARPTGRTIATLTVDTRFDGSATNFHLIGDALTQAATLQDAAIQQGSLAPGEFSTLGSPRGPDYRVDIIVAAGTYTEELGAGSWVNLVGATGDPDDVVIQTNATGGGVFHPFGPLYVEGIRFNALTNGGAPDTGPKYPVHLTTGGPGAAVFVACKFISTNPGGSGSFGMDGGGGLFVYFYDSDFSAPGGVMNLHGGTGNTTPVVVVWENCTNNGDFTYSEDGSATDDVWLIGSTGGALDTTGAVTEHTAGTPPRPAGALGALGQSYYYPEDITGPHPVTQTYGAGDQASFTPVANRVYYVRVTPTSAIHRTHMGVVAAAAGGVVGVRSVRRATPYPTGDTPGLGSTGTLVVGANDVQSNFYDTYYPGESVWVIVQATSGTPSLQGSLTQAAGAYYSDNGGTTITAVPGGTRVPVVRLRSDS
jgi:hypothetical protein